MATVCALHILNITRSPVEEPKAFGESVFLQILEFCLSFKICLSAARLNEIFNSLACPRAVAC